MTQSVSHDGDVHTALQSQLNWIRANSGEPLHEVLEYPIWTDAHILGEETLGLGPYSFLNTVPRGFDPGNVRVSIIARAGIHLGEHRPSMKQKDDSLYHGGTLSDELAALCSLCLGIRTRSGGTSRRFEGESDRYGFPTAWSERSKPELHLDRDCERLVLPSVVGQHNLQSIGLMRTIPNIEPKLFVELVRASRLYQDALWVGETEPNLAWLMFVSALEVSANAWAIGKKKPMERIEVAWPELHALLSSSSDAENAAKIAKLLAPTVKATERFIDFTMKFMPPPPEKRPIANMYRFTWTEEVSQRMFRQVYKYRSFALHAGKPFPAPMLEPAYKHDESRLPSELPLTGLASYSRGGTWLAEDMPINLHMFEYITRHSLLNWWKTLAPPIEDDSASARGQ